MPTNVGTQKKSHIDQLGVLLEEQIGVQGQTDSMPNQTFRETFKAAVREAIVEIIDDSLRKHGKHPDQGQERNG